ncbi:MAG: hypothetical protein JWL76_2319 [Thermoleophilia bacterium]|nr:hypothetical protein [Thermoleophilia bacterium]
MQAHTPTRRVGLRADPERAVSLVEVVIVVLIIGILGAAIFAARNSSSRAGSVTAARAAGQSYHDAIEAFMRDHGGRVPVLNDPEDWPTTPPAGSGVTGGAGGLWGPINFGARGKPYLDKIPESINDGRVALGTAAASPGVRARLLYERIGARQYRLSVQRATSTSWATSCEFGTEGGNQC